LTDASKDRIVVCSNGGQTVFGEPNSAYYKINKLIILVSLYLDLMNH